MLNSLNATNSISKQLKLQVYGYTMSSVIKHTLLQTYQNDSFDLNALNTLSYLSPNIFSAKQNTKPKNDHFSITGKFFKATILLTLINLSKNYIF
jgi:hypothetical protein